MPDTIQQPVAYWLAELDIHGNPKLVDGSHSERSGAEKAYYLYQRLGFAGEGKQFAVARVELSEVTGSSEGVDQEALGIVKATLDQYRKDVPDA